MCIVPRNLKRKIKTKTKKQRYKQKLCIVIPELIGQTAGTHSQEILHIYETTHECYLLNKPDETKEKELAHLQSYPTHCSMSFSFSDGWYVESDIISVDCDKYSV